MKNIKVLGIPFSFGQPHLGVELAMQAMRQHGLLKKLSLLAPILDLGDLDFTLLRRQEKRKFIHNQAAVAMGNELISSCIEREDLTQSFLLNVGGDHGLALGTIHGLLSHQPKMVVVWADAHGDINTPNSSPSGNFHGMPLSFLLAASKSSQSFGWLKRRLQAQQLIFFGPRDLDGEELKLIQELSIQYFSSEAVNYYGTEEIMPLALQVADPTGQAPIHLSFDVDLFDSSDVYATGTRVINGPEVNQVMKLGEMLGQTGRLKSMDLVEINPLVGTETQVNHTLELASSFAELTIKSTFKHVRERCFQEPPEFVYR